MDIKFRKNIAALLILQKANYILPFVVIPYLTRTLGPDNFGKISFIQAVINYFVLFTDFGFNMSATQHVALSRNNIDELSKIFWTTTFSKMLLAIVSFFLLLCLILAIPEMRSSFFLYMIGFFVVLQSLFSPTWFFQGIEKTQWIIPISVIPRAVSILLVFVFIKTSNDFTAALFIQSFVCFIMTIIITVIFFLRKKLIKWYVPKIAEIKNALDDGWHLFLSTAAISLYTTSNTVLLGIIANDKMVGYFVAADKLIKGVQSLTFTIGQAAYPRMTIYAKESKEKALAFLKKCYKIMSISGLVCSIFLFLFADILIRIVFGAQYLPSKALLQIMSPAPFIVILSYVFGILGLLPFGLKKTYSTIYIITGLASIAFTIPLAFYYNMYGICVSVILTEIFITIVTYSALKRNNINLSLI
ncbi:flippase [Pinibacter aurantiacus]|uniref:Flippase n=1 Tax=Pinibacter aurantiacus TaxID=2851599 RepID=A0A9E2W7C0_9BACT|nr:flippase [Pinibacter aurantiacus]MBV4356371.1 flippase [Pinibacter aurantiacus]